MKKIMFAFLLACSSVHSGEVRFPPGEEPLLSFNESAECVEPTEGYVPAKIKVKDGVVHLNFQLMTTGGHILVNPLVHKGYESLTISVDRAHKTNIYLGCFCIKSIQASIKADFSPYKKIYIVSNKVVVHEITVPR